MLVTSSAGEPCPSVQVQKGHNAWMFIASDAEDPCLNVEVQKVTVPDCWLLVVVGI